MTDEHRTEHELAKIACHVKQAQMKLAPFYSTDAGADVNFHLREAIAILDKIDSIIFHRILNREG